MVQGNFQYISVVVEAESNTKIKSIEIPVWTKSDQSDIKWYEAILLSGNKYKATVKSSDFNYSRGSYKIHCYAYDIAGIKILFALAIFKIDSFSFAKSSFPSIVSLI